MRPYLENQRNETERSNSYNQYYKNKYEAIIKSLTYLERVESKLQDFRVEERANYERARNEEGKDFAEIEKDWLAYQNSDVIEHYPPQVIIGR